MNKKDYLSELDQMLAKMRVASNRSPAEIQEIAKYDRINMLRDNKIEEDPDDSII